MMEPSAAEIPAPRPLDILCGRGRANNSHSGNMFFRSVVACHLPKYSSENTSRTEKSALVVSVIQLCFDQGCRFIKNDSDSNYGQWKELSLTEIKLKVGHAIRDACSDMIKTLNPSTNNVIADEDIVHHDQLEPRELDITECEKIEIIRNAQNAKKSNKRRRNIEVPSGAAEAYLPPAIEFIPLHFNIEQENQKAAKLVRDALLAQPYDATSFAAVTLVQQQQQALQTAMRRKTSAVGPNASKRQRMSEQFEDNIAIPQVFECLSPETQRQIQVLYADANVFTTLLASLSETQDELTASDEEADAALSSRKI